MLTPDRMLVQGHINALRATAQPQPNLRSTLSARLEGRLQAALATATVNPQSINFADVQISPIVDTHQSFSSSSADGLFGVTDIDSWWSQGLNNQGDVGNVSGQIGENPFDLGLGNWPPAFQRILGGLMDSGDGMR